MKLSWCPDLTAESNLRRLGVVFDVGTVAFSKLDLKESRVNGARLGDPIRKDLVSDYRQSMLNGDTFPRCIVHPNGESGWVVLSGVQRTAAVEELIKEGKLPKDPQLEVYKLDECDKLLREIIARSSNAVHGGRSGYEERLAHAIYCCRELGMSAPDAAKTFCVGRDAIVKNIRAEKERESLMRSGVDASRLPVSTLDAISKLPFDSSAKQAIASLTVQHDVPAEKVKAVVNTLKTSKSQQERTAKIKEFERDLAQQARAVARPVVSNGSTKAPSRPRRDKVLRMIESLTEFLEHGNEGGSFTTLDQLQFTGDADNARLKTLVGRLQLRWNVLGV